MADRMRNQKGFMTIGFLALVPLLLSAVAVSASAYFAIRDDSHVRHTCRLTLLESQQKVSQILHELMKLNSKAEGLRKLRDSIKLARDADPEPNSRAALTAALAAVEAKQKLLGSRQRLLILKGKTESRLGVQEARMRIGSLLSAQSSLRGRQAGSLHLRFDSQTGAFDVIATPRESLTPSYHPSLRFSEKQTMKVYVTFSPSGLLPSWLFELISKSNSNRFTPNQAINLALEAGCSTTLQRERNGSWDAKLIADKSSSNSR